MKRTAVATSDERLSLPRPPSYLSPCVCSHASWRPCQDCKLRIERSGRGTYASQDGARTGRLRWANRPLSSAAPPEPAPAVGGEHEP